MTCPWKSGPRCAAVPRGVSCFAVVWLLSALPLHADLIDVFFMSGQSNMSGRVNTGYVNDPRDAAVRYYFRTDGPFSNQALSSGFTTLQPLSNGYYGPEISAGRALVDRGYQPAIIKVSRGATTLLSDWNPGGSGVPSGTWWNHWATDSISALAALESQGHQVNLRGFFWLQGETDSDTVTASNAYEANFDAFTARVYDHLQTQGYDPSGMSFVTALIRDNGQPTTATIRAAQTTIMDALPNGAWFDTSDLTTFDSLHFNAAGVSEIGLRFAGQMASVPEPSLVGCWAGGAILLGGVSIGKRLRASRGTARQNLAGAA